MSAKGKDGPAEVPKEKRILAIYTEAAFIQRLDQEAKTIKKEIEEHQVELIKAMVKHQLVAYRDPETGVTVMLDEILKVKVK